MFNARDNITGDESDDNSTHFSDSHSEYNGEQTANGDDPVQIVQSQWIWVQREIMTDLLHHTILKPRGKKLCKH